MKYLSVGLITCMSVSSALFSYGLPSYSQTALRSLQPKFTPDPQVYTGTTSGSATLQSIAGSGAVDGKCQGFSTETASYVFRALKPFDLLSLKVFNGNGQATLLVKGPDGIYCRDSSNPELLGAWPAGDYQIWVGSKTGEPLDYKLSISETKQ